MSTTAAQSPPEGGPEVSASAPQDAPPPPASPPATLREDQIQNAVAFLTHPKVQGSLPAAKRSFLERKGLTAAEIEEALRRVPQPSVSAPSAATPAAPFAPAAQQLQTYNGPQLPPQPPPGQQLAVVPAPQPVRWTQVVLGAGVIAAGLYAVKQLVAPHVTSYYHHVVDARRKRQEAAEKREREMHEALLSMRQLQEQLLGSISGLTEVTRELKEQNQVNQYASSRAAAGLLGAGGAGLTTHMNQLFDEPDVGTSQELRQELTELRAAVQRLQLQPAALRSGTPDRHQHQHQQQRSPVQSPSASAAAAAAGRQAEARLRSGTFGRVTPPGSSGDLHAYGSANAAEGRPPSAGARAASELQFGDLPGGRLPEAVPDAAAAEPDEAPHSRAFYEVGQPRVMDMVSRGITPPNVRTDIDDKPPNPQRALSESRVAARPKPWERASQDGSRPSTADTASTSSAAVPATRQQHSGAGGGGSSSSATPFAQPPWAGATATGSSSSGHHAGAGASGSSAGWDRGAGSQQQSAQPTAATAAPAAGVSGAQRSAEPPARPRPQRDTQLHNPVAAVAAQGAVPRAATPDGQFVRDTYARPPAPQPAPYQPPIARLARPSFAMRDDDTGAGPSTLAPPRDPSGSGPPTEAVASPNTPRGPQLQPLFAAAVDADAGSDAGAATAGAATAAAAVPQEATDGVVTPSSPSPYKGRGFFVGPHSRLLADAQPSALPSHMTDDSQMNPWGSAASSPVPQQRGDRMDAFRATSPEQQQQPEAQEQPPQPTVRTGDAAASGAPAGGWRPPPPPQPSIRMPLRVEAAEFPGGAAGRSSSNDRSGQAQSSAAAALASPPAAAINQRSQQQEEQQQQQQRPVDELQAAQPNEEHLAALLQRPGPDAAPGASVEDEGGHAAGSLAAESAGAVGPQDMLTEQQLEREGAELSRAAQQFDL